MFSAKDLFFVPQGGYTIAKSLRFRSSASAYLSRTFGTPTNATVWTLSLWVKRGAFGGTQEIISSSNGSANQCSIQFNGSDQLRVLNYISSAFKTQKITNAVFRDPSAWYHIVVSQNSSTAFNLYVNNVSQTFGTSTGPDGSDWLINQSGRTVNIGREQLGGVNYFDGYLSEVNFIDGQALDPTYFGQTDTATGVWMPKKYTGTYGTNGFYLNFSDASAATAAAIGKDSSGNSNNWTPNNISVTAGVTYDSMVDTPTNYDNGGNGAGNYCVANAVNKSATITDGNLQISNGNGIGLNFVGTIGVSSGKWYWEITATGGSGAVSNTFEFGVLGGAFGSNYLTTSPDSVTGAYVYYGYTGFKYVNGTGSAYGATYATGDVIGFALDMDAGTLTCYKNNATQGVLSSGLSGTFYPYGGNGSTNSNTQFALNFGQRPFTYTPPSGFKALNTQNLPTPTIGATSSTLANKYMDIALYNGTSASNSITSLNFKPDLVWIKSRSAATAHELTDAVRGVTKSLSSNSTAAEATDTNGLTAFLSNGFTVGSDSNYNNGTGPATYVAWNWLGANGTASNTSGSITSTVSANVTAGFSVVTYTGTGANATVGHGLGVAPKMVIVKKRGSTGNWVVYHSNLTSATYYLVLNLTAAQASAATVWNSTAPTSSVFSLGTDADVNSATTNVAYCFAEVAGYSKFGSYTGNGSADGPFVYCGFRPKYVLIKRTDTTSSWAVHDTSRDTYNVSVSELYPDLSQAEATASTGNFDFVSNGIKVRSTLYNASGGTYIFAAFAETPFNYSRGR